MLVSYCNHSSTEDLVDDEYEDDAETDDNVDEGDSAADMKASLYVGRQGDGQDSPVFVNCLILTDSLFTCSPVNDYVPAKP